MLPFAIVVVDDDVFTPIVISHVKQKDKQCQSQSQSQSFNVTNSRPDKKKALTKQHGHEKRQNKTTNANRSSTCQQTKKKQSKKQNRTHQKKNKKKQTTAEAKIEQKVRKNNGQFKCQKQHKTCCCCWSLFIITRLCFIFGFGFLWLTRLTIF